MSQPTKMIMMGTELLRITPLVAGGYCKAAEAKAVWMASNICVWMTDVAAAWLMTSLTSSPTLIALVQTASSLPVFLLGLPSGAFADILDRRRYFMVSQFWIAVTAAVIYTFAVIGH